jgi:DNA-binding HxlR family transcriptional regulator
MEFEMLFTDQKWSILKNLSAEKYSPLQLAGKSQTSIANISQQLRLLEAANIVQKEKIPNRDKGKPRTLFSLTNNYAYLISTMNDFAEKRLLELTDYHQIILKIWYIKDPELHYHLEKFYWKIEPYLKEIDGIAFIQKPDECKILITSDKLKESNKKLDDISIKNTEKIVEVSILTTKESQKYFRNLDVSKVLLIYDPKSIMKEIYKEKASQKT